MKAGPVSFHIAAGGETLIAVLRGARTKLGTSGFEEGVCLRLPIIIQLFLRETVCQIEKLVQDKNRKLTSPVFLESSPHFSNRFQVCDCI